MCASSDQYRLLLLLLLGPHPKKDHFFDDHWYEGFLWYFGLWRTGREFYQPSDFRAIESLEVDDSLNGDDDEETDLEEENQEEENENKDPDGYGESDEEEELEEEVRTCIY